MGETNDLKVEEEIVEITEVTSEDETKWTAELYDSEEDEEPSAKIEVNSMSNLFHRATNLVESCV